MVGAFLMVTPKTHLPNEEGNMRSSGGGPLPLAKQHHH